MNMKKVLFLTMRGVDNNIMAWFRRGSDEDNFLMIWDEIMKEESLSFLTKTDKELEQELKRKLQRLFYLTEMTNE